MKKYKNIENCGFNFSHRFKCEFKSVYKKDENGEKVLDENKSELIICDKSKKECEDNNYIENFFGDNINVTAIVGKNGSGKSNILNCIINSNEEDSTKPEKNILIFWDKGLFYIKNDNTVNFTCNVPIVSGVAYLPMIRL